MMNTMFKILLYCTVILSINACADLEFSDCESPKTSTIYGEVIDYHTSYPVADASITFSNFSFDAENPRQTIQSNNLGYFTYTDTGCSITDNLFHFREASHPAYQGAINTSSADNLDVYLFEKRDIKLIFNNTNPQTVNDIKYNYNYTIKPKSTRYGFPKGDRFVGQDSDTIIINVGKDAPLEFSYKLKDDPWVYFTEESIGVDQFIIEY